MTQPPPPVEEEAEPTRASAIRRDSLQRESLREIVFLLKQELMQSETGSSSSRRTFVWLACKPDKIYHPKAWVQAWDDDTEDMYEKKQLKEVPRTKIIKYFSGEDEDGTIMPLEWHITQTREIVPADVEFLSTFDLSLKDDFTFFPTRLFFPKSETQGSANDIQSVLSPQESEAREEALTAYKDHLISTLNRSVICFFLLLLDANI